MGYPVCYIKNISGVVKALFEHEFAVDEVFEIDDSKRDVWAGNDDVLVAISNGLVEVRDGNGVVGGVSDQIDYLKNNVVKSYISGSDIVIPTQQRGFVDISGYPYFCSGLSGVAVPAGSEPTISIKHSVFSSNVRIAGGGVIFGSTSSPGNYAILDMVYGDVASGVVVGQFVESLYLLPDTKWEVMLQDTMLVPAGIKLRVRYVNTGSEEVPFCVWFHLRRVPS